MREVFGQVRSGRKLMLLAALRGLMLLAVASLVALMVHAGDPRRISWWFPAILFGIWI